MTSLHCILPLLYLYMQFPLRVGVVVKRAVLGCSHTAHTLLQH